jgi:hypothetical protein
MPRCRKTCIIQTPVKLFIHSILQVAILTNLLSPLPMPILWKDGSAIYRFPKFTTKTHQQHVDFSKTAWQVVRLFRCTGSK